VAVTGPGLPRVGLYDELTPHVGLVTRRVRGMSLGGCERYKVTQVLISRDSAAVASGTAVPGPAGGRA
jgi:hypothetical protein